MVFLLSFWLVIVDIYFPPSSHHQGAKCHLLHCLSPKERMHIWYFFHIEWRILCWPCLETEPFSQCLLSPAENYRVYVCVCVCVCPQFFHFKETPKEKLNNTLPLTKSIKQLCPHVFLDLKVLYLNSFQIMSKKNDVTVYVGSRKVLYLFHTIQIVSRAFFLLISWRTNLTTWLAPFPLLPERLRSFPPLSKRGKMECKAEPNK